jgi:hypothetical protein
VAWRPSNPGRLGFRRPVRLPLHGRALPPGPAVVGRAGPGARVLGRGGRGAATVHGKRAGVQGGGVGESRGEGMGWHRPSCWMGDWRPRRGWFKYGAASDSNPSDSLRKIPAAGARVERDSIKMGDVGPCDHRVAAAVAQDAFRSSIVPLFEETNRRYSLAALRQQCLERKGKVQQKNQMGWGEEQ